MTRLIAHRGNIAGPNPESENKIDYLLKALSLGFDIEVDVRLKEGKLYLGHDVEQEQIESSFLKNKRVWTHCKDIESFNYLLQFKDINCFYQNNEDIVLTSRGFVWHHSSNTNFGKKSIGVCLDYNQDFDNNISSMYGLCSDYVGSYTVSPKNNSSSGLFKLLVIDIDGVMTDGRKYYDLNGEILSKTYYDQDFTAIKRFKSAGIQVCFLSGDRTINEKMAEIRKIDFYFARDPVTGSIDKANFLSKLCETYNVFTNEIAYVGDDYYDLSIIESLKYTYCPSNAVFDLRQVVHKVLGVEGGHGVIAKLYEEYKDLVDYSFPIDSFEVNNK
jgi:3-deoxy-D-manno-octulosonate 8-phosphate phosphatase (KDO 8-P phosphatase)